MNKEQAKDKIKDLITRVWKAESQFFKTVVDRNICETELTEIWERFSDTFDELIDPVNQHEREDYEESIEALEEELEYTRGQVDDLADKNCELREENEKLWDRLKEISKVVNDTWC